MQPASRLSLDGDDSERLDDCEERYSADGFWPGRGVWTIRQLCLESLNGFFELLDSPHQARKDRFSCRRGRRDAKPSAGVVSIFGDREWGGDRRRAVPGDSVLADHDVPFSSRANLEGRRPLVPTLHLLETTAGLDDVVTACAAGLEHEDDTFCFHLSGPGARRIPTPRLNEDDVGLWI